MTTVAPEATVPSVPFVVRGRVVHGGDTLHESRDLGASFATPKLDLDALVSSRREPGPAFGTPAADIVDFLADVGDRLQPDGNPYLAEALEHMSRVNPLGERIVRHCYEELPVYFDRRSLQFQIDQELGGAAVIDGWQAVTTPHGRTDAVRAFPGRLVHVLAGNGPGVAAITIVRAALTKGVHLLKLPSNDLFTATAILRTMADVDADHPTLRSFSAAYWRGGDESVESVLFRPQWFDKLVAWGGEGAIRSALRYLGPGFELVAFDPKISISLIGREAFESDETLARVAALAAADAAILNQDACAASRYQYVEGDTGDADRYCEQLLAELARDRRLSSGTEPKPPADVRDQVDGLRHLEPDYRVFGAYDGRGLVVRSPEPVEFHPTGKTVNVVTVPSLMAAAGYATVATQTVSLYPPARKAEVRDALVGAGVQRIVPLGGSSDLLAGMPHDGMYPLSRMVRWAVDEGERDA